MKFDWESRNFIIEQFLEGQVYRKRRYRLRFAVGWAEASGKVQDFDSAVRRFESFSIGAGGVKRFQTAPSIWWGCHSQGSSLLFGIGTLALP
jgi:hypothetical protein